MHLVVAYLLAAFSSAFTPPALADVEEKPPELTVVDLSPATPVQKNPQFLETDPARASVEKPADQTFESNTNSVAASNAPAAGDLPLPSQSGRDQPDVDLQTEQYSLPSSGAKSRPAVPAPQSAPERSTPAPKAQETPSPTARPSESPPPTATPPPPSTPEPEQLAMLRPTPPPPLTPEEPEKMPSIAPETAPSTRPQPERPASEYRPQKEQTRIIGSISKRGPSAVNAVGTPIGRYQKSVYDAIGARWYHYMRENMDLVTIGTAQVSAEIAPDGHIQNLRVLSNNANEAFANICLRSFEEAKLPPIPPELATLLPDGRMQVDISFTTY